MKTTDGLLSCVQQERFRRIIQFTSSHIVLQFELVDTRTLKRSRSVLATLRAQPVAIALVDVFASLAPLVEHEARFTQTHRSVRRNLTALWTPQRIALLRITRSSLVAMISAIILPIADLFQINARIVVRTFELPVLQVALGEAVLLIRSIATVVDPVAHPIVAFDALLILAQKSLALALDVLAAKRLVRSVQTVRHPVAYQIQRDAHLVRAGELELAARDRDVWDLEVFAVLLVVSQRTVVVLVAQEGRTDAAVVVLAAVPHRFLAQEVITPNLIAPVGTVLGTVAVVHVRNACSVITAVFVFTACRSLRNPTAGRGLATGVHASNIDNDAKSDQQQYDRTRS